MLPIDWSTLELQLGAFLMILGGTIAGYGRIMPGGKNWLSAVGLWGSRIASCLTGQNHGFIVGLFVFTAGVAAILIGTLIFQDFPLTGDEWSYFLQAQIFSRGHLQVDSPTHPRFFDVWAMVNDGKFYAWAPPGWPFLLMPGIVLGVPWLMNPVAGALTMLIVYRLGRLVYNRVVSLLALVFMLFSPFFLLHSASYFAHPSSLLFITLCVFFYAKGIASKASLNFLLAGLCGSMSFLIRPFDQVAVFSPLGAYLLVLRSRREVALRQLVWFGMSHALGIFLMLAYNYLQTGNPLTMGYHVGYDGFLFDPYLRGRQFIPEYLLHLLVWTFPFVLPLALIYSIWPGAMQKKSPTEQQWNVLLLLIFLSNVFWYAFVPFHYWVGYGPRYYYGSFFAVVLLGARGTVALIDRLSPRWTSRERQGWAAIVLGICLTLSVFWLFPVKLAEAHRYIEARRALYRTVEQEKLQNAVVFIRAVSGNYFPWNLTRNTPDFQGPVLYVHDLQDSNWLLFQQYPGRRFFVYEYDEKKQPILQEIVPNGAFEARD
jgi:Dolichyl-phosphate-mannose-protein mannosyltransferase